MKRALWLYGLLVLALAGCSGSTDDGPDKPGEVSSERTSVVLVRVDGVAANGSDAAVVRVIARDENGRPIPNRLVEARSSNLNDAIIVNPPRTDKDGMAEIHVTATEVGTRVLSLTVHSLALPQRPQLTFVAGSGTHLEFVETPGTGQAGRPLRPAVRVEVKDERGNRVADSNAEISLQVSGGEVLKENAVAGVATFNNVVINEPGEEHHLTASAEGMESAISETIEVIVGTPSQLTFERQPPTEVSVGENITVSVAVRDPAGNVVLDSSDMVRVRLYSNPPAAKLLGTLEVQAVEGIATFDDLEIHKSSAGYQLTASARGYKSAESDSFTVGNLNPDLASSFIRIDEEEPVAVANGREQLRIVGRIADEMGNPLSGYPFTLSASGTGHRFHPSLQGEGTVYSSITTGTGEFSARISSTVAGEKQIVLSVGDSFDIETSVTFLPDFVSADKSEFVRGADSAVADGEERIEFEVHVKDPNGNAVPGAAVSFTADGSANDYPDGTARDTDDKGIARFSLVSEVAEEKTVTASVAGFNMETTVIFRPGEPSFYTSNLADDDEGDGSTNVVGTTMAEPFRVVVRDAQNNPVPGAKVTFEIVPDSEGETHDANFLPDGGVTQDVFTEDDGVAEVYMNMGVKTGGYNVIWRGEWTDFAGDKNARVVASPSDGIRLVLVDGNNEPYLIDGDTGVPYKMDGGTRVDHPIVAVAGQEIVPLRFQVRDQFDNATGGAVLEIQGEGAFAPANPPVSDWSEANLNPVATTNWTLDDTAGPNTITVTTPHPVPGQPILSLSFAATGISGDPAKLVLPEGFDPVLAGTVGGSLPGLQLQVLDANDNPVEGAELSIVLSHGDSNAAVTDPAPTGENGITSFDYTLGTESGPQTITVTVVDAPGVTPYVFTIDAGPDEAHEMVIVDGGNDQEAKVGEVLANPLQVMVIDVHNNPVPDTPVSFVITTSAGPGAELTDVDAMTGEDGIASATFTMGNVPGPYAVTVTSDVNDVTFDLTGLHGDPATIELESGEDATGTVAKEADKPLVVVVKDNQGNVLAGRGDVIFTAADTTFANGGVAPETDENGRTSIELTKFPTKSGPVEVTVACEDARLEFILVASADKPDSITTVSGSGQEGDAGVDLIDPVEILVLDQWQNPVPDVEVTVVSKPNVEGLFRPLGTAAPGANPAVLTTDDDGTVFIVWTLPAGTHGHFAEASVGDVKEPAKFHAYADVGAPAAMEIEEGQDETAEVDGQIVISVTVEDAAGHDVSDTPIEFTVIPGNENDATVTNGVDTDVTVVQNTDSSGTATVTVLVGTKAVPFQVVARALDAADPDTVQVTFDLAATAGAPADLRLVSESHFEDGVVGSELTEPLQVQLVDDYLNPVAGRTVSFGSEDPTEGSFRTAGEVGNPAEAVTDADGIAEAWWTLHTVPGAGYAAKAIFSDVEGEFEVDFTADAAVGAPAVVEIIEGGPGSDTAEVDGSIELLVLVKDSFDNPIGDTPVEFAIEAGTHTAVIDDGEEESEGVGIFVVNTNDSEDPDEFGYAGVTIHVGTKADSFTVLATALAADPEDDVFATFNLTSTPGDAADLLLVSESHFPDGVVGTELEDALQVRLVDRHLNPIEGELVSFGSADPTEGSFRTDLGAGNPMDATTDDQGLAQAWWTLHTLPGDGYAAKAIFSDPDGDFEVDFTADAAVGEPANMVITAGENGKAQVGDGEIDLAVRVFDIQGNALGANTPVDFAFADGTHGATFEGGLTMTTVPTDVDGVAGVKVLVGEAAVEFQVLASAGDANTTFFLEATPGDPASLVLESAAHFPDGTVGMELTSPLQVRLLDDYLNPIEGRLVSFGSVVAGQGSFRTDLGAGNPMNATTDDQGLAQAWWTLHTVPGDGYEAKAIFSDVEGEFEVDFTADAAVGDPAQIVILDDLPVAVSPEADPVDIRGQVQDAFGNPVGEDIQVTFTVTSGDSTVNGLNSVTVPTGTTGEAEVTVAFGTEAGDVTITATIGGEFPETWNTEIEAGPATQISIVSGDGVMAPVGRPIDLVVLVQDAWFNPVFNEPVTFDSADGTPANDVIHTLDDGTATLAFTPGELGEDANVVTATITVEGVDEQVTFTITGIVDAEEFVLVAGDRQFTQRGEGFGNPVVVRVLDENGDPVEGVEVTFEVDVAEGSVDDPTPATNVDGYAFTTVTSAAGYMGDVTVTATVADSLLNPVEFTLESINTGACIAGGRHVYYAGMPTPWGAVPETGIFTAGNVGVADTYQVRVVEAVEGAPELGLVYDGFAFHCTWNDGVDDITNVVVVTPGDDGLVMTLDGNVVEIEDLPSGILANVDPSGWLYVGCDSGHGFALPEDVGGSMPSLLVNDSPATMTGGFCEDPAVYTEVAAPGLFPVTP